MREFPGNSVGQMCLNKARLCYFITVLSARRPEGFLSSRRPPLCLLCQISDIVLGGSKGAATPRFIQTNWLNPSSLISDLLRALITHVLYVCTCPTQQTLTTRSLSITVSCAGSPLLCPPAGCFTCS